MPTTASYDLMVLLDPEADEDARTGVLERIKGQLQSGEASLKGDSDWGMRRLAYEIDHRNEAQYHLFQFEAAPAVLSELDRTLSIDDVVLRFRTIRLPGEAPEVTPPAPPQVTLEPRPRREDRGGRRDDRGRDSDERRQPEEAPVQPEEAPAPEADEELARAESEAAGDEPAPAGEADGEPAAS